MVSVPCFSLLCVRSFLVDFAPLTTLLCLVQQATKLYSRLVIDRSIARSLPVESKIRRDRRDEKSMCVCVCMCEDDFCTWMG